MSILFFPILSAGTKKSTKSKAFTSVEWVSVPRMFLHRAFDCGHIDLPKKTQEIITQEPIWEPACVRPMVRSVGLLTRWRISSEETTAYEQKAAKVFEVNALPFELIAILKVQTFPKNHNFSEIFLFFPKL